MSDTCCIKVTTNNAGTKVVIAIHELTSLSLADIKSRQASGEPVVEFCQSDMNGWATIIQLADALDVPTQAYLGDTPFPTSHFANRLREEKEDIACAGEEDAYEDEPCWNLDLGKFE